MKYLVLLSAMSCCCMAQESKESKQSPRVTLKQLLIPPLRWRIPIEYRPPMPESPKRDHLVPPPPINHNASDSPHPRVKRKKLTLPPTGD